MARVIAATTTQAVLVTVAAFSSGWMGWMTMYSSPDSTADTPAARVSSDVVMVMAAPRSTWVPAGAGAQLEAWRRSRNAGSHHLVASVVISWEGPLAIRLPPWSGADVDVGALP